MFERIKNYRFPHVLWHDGSESKKTQLREAIRTYEGGIREYPREVHITKRKSDVSSDRDFWRTMRSKRD